MQIRMIVAGSLLACVASASNAQGFVDFSAIPGLDVEPIVEVNVGPLAIALLRNTMLATQSALDGEPDPYLTEMADLLMKLRGIQLRSYGAKENSNELSEFIDDTSRDLERSGWERMMSVQDEGSKVSMLVRMTEQDISGVTVMAIDGTEAFFVNVDATVTVEDLGKILAQFQMHGVLEALGGGMPMLVPPPPARPID